MTWVEKDNALNAVVTFKDFDEAFDFIQQVARIAKEHNHHPEWINVYNKVTFRLCTHDAGNVITNQDRRLANAISSLYIEYFSK